MICLPDAAVHDVPVKEDAYRAQVEGLQDGFLLCLRAGAWCQVAKLAAWLAPRLKAEHAVQRFLEAGGTREQKLEHKISEGQELVLQDMLDTLQRKQLVAVRDGVAGREVRSTPLIDDRFDIDPEFENLLPRAADEVKKLEEHLLVETLRDPLVVWKGHRILVDGHTRFRFLALLGRTCPLIEMDFANRAAVIAWLYDTHYGRRSYSAEMKSYVRGTAYLVRKRQHGGVRKKASAQSGHLKTADAVAAEYCVGRNTVRRDAVFAEAVDMLASTCGDTVRQQVLTRQTRWTRGDVVRLAKLDQSTLQEVFRVALASGQRPKLPGEQRPARQALSLPLGRPIAQVRVLKKVLGLKDLSRLQTALARFFEQQRVRSSCGEV
jgi:hypothetical protein